MSNNVKLAVINIPATDPEATAKFYSKLLNRQLTQSPTDATVCYGTPLEDGVYLTIKRRERPEEGTTIFLAVEHLDQAIAAFESGGGKLLSKHELPISSKVQTEYADAVKTVYGPKDAQVPNHMGSSAVVSDREGNRIGLIEVHEHAHAMFKLGKHATPQTPHQAAVQAAAETIEKAFKKP